MVWAAGGGPCRAAGPPGSPAGCGAGVVSRWRMRPLARPCRCWSCWLPGWRLAPAPGCSWPAPPRPRAGHGDGQRIAGDGVRSSAGRYRGRGRRPL